MMSSLEPLVCVSGWAHSGDALFDFCSSIDLKCFAFGPHELVADNSGEINHVAGELSSYALGLREELLTLASPGVVLGWSMGAMIALETALHFPELVKELILVSCCPRFTASSSFADGTAVEQLRAMAEGVQRAPRKTLESFYKQLRAPQAVELPMMELFVRDALKIEEARLLAGLSYLESFDVCDEVGSLSVPVSIIHGKEDRVIAPAGALSLAKKVKHANCVLVDGVGHDLLEMRAAIIATILC